ncbi:MAG: 3'-5' exonuclease [bacterium]|nr:3'-5' exonuclease [bacterium]
MAICIPQSPEFETAGERKTFDMLKKLPDTCIVWYEVVMHERNHRPDFMVLDPIYGLLIIEVKDWDKNSIKRATQSAFTIQRQGGTAQERKNPDLKCRQYLRYAREKLELRPPLTDDYGRTIVSTDYLLVFPNLSKKDFEEIELGQIINTDKVLFSDNFKHHHVLTKKLSGLQRSNLTPAQVAEIRLALRDEITIQAQPQNAQNMTVQKRIVSSEDIKTAFAVDMNQEQVAKSLGEGPRLLRGMAGSGKTLILLLRAKLVAANAEVQNKPQRILVLCWNISLANYMRQAFTNINIPYEGLILDKPRPSETTSVEILSFILWLRTLFQTYSKKRLPKSTEPDFLIKVTELMKDLVIPPEALYDAIYVDEGQDFRPEWLKFLFEKALKGNKPQEKNFIISADDAQRIYKHQGHAEFSWANLGIPMQGRSKVFRRVYRNSVRVWLFAGFFLGDIEQYYVDDDKTTPDIWFAPKKGIDPELMACESLGAQIKETVKTITDLKKQGHSLSNVLVLYHSKTVGKYPLIAKLISQLKTAGITDVDWISEDAQSKSTFDWTRESVKISTVHSAKGLDAPVVIVLSAESFYHGSDDVDNRKLMYVAMTRAREYLKILYTGENPIITELLASQKEYQQRHDVVLELERRSNETPF